MSKKANPTAIGAFVIAAVVIAVAGIIVLGSGKMFEHAVYYTLYFDGDLNGLDVGAPVTSKGVKIGEVARISIVYDHATDTVTTPVVIKIIQGSFVEINRDPDKPAMTGEVMPVHVQRGLRARLETLSLVTGKLRISLDFHPETEAVFRSHDPDVMEIPTIPTSLQSLFNRLSRLPVDEILQDLQKSMSEVARFFESGKIDQTFDELNRSLEEISKVVQSSDLQSVIRSIDGTLTQTQALMESLQDSAKPMQRDLRAAIEEFTDAARAARNLLDYLERHPESMLKGKGSEK